MNYHKRYLRLKNLLYPRNFSERILGLSDGKDRQISNSKPSIPSYQDRRETACNTKIGDVWQNIKNGKKCTVTDISKYQLLELSHEDGRRSQKECNYLAEDYYQIK